MAGEATKAIGARNDALVERHQARLKLATELFREIHAPDCPFVQAHLGLVHLCLILCDVSLPLHGRKHLASELLSNVLGAFGAKRNGVIERSVHDDFVQSTRTRETASVQYVDVMDSRLAEAARTVEASSDVWTQDQRRFRELADAVRAVRRRLSVRQLASRTSRMFSAPLVTLCRAQRCESLRAYVRSVAS